MNNIINIVYIIMGTVLGILGLSATDDAFPALSSNLSLTNPSAVEVT